MNRVIAAAVAAAVVLVLILAAAAPARVTRWNVAATLSGSYGNAVAATASAQCPAHYAERLSGLKATFSSRRAIAYDPAARAFTGLLRYRVAGRWSVSGGYVPLRGQPDGTLACAGAETPVACGARVVFEDGHRTSTTGTARLAVDTNAHGAVGSRIDAPRLTEQYADAGTPPQGWPGVCTLSPDDEAIPAAPLFGLSTSEVLDRALATRIRFPAARLAGHRRFTVTTAARRASACPAQGFDPCVEHGSFRVRVTLTPAAGTAAQG
jgi:hypothetical protein